MNLTFKKKMMKRSNLSAEARKEAAAIKAKHLPTLWIFIRPPRTFCFPTFTLMRKKIYANMSLKW